MTAIELPARNPIIQLAPAHAMLDSQPVALQWLSDLGLPVEASFRLAGDLDGDGNIDLVGPRGVFYGSGVRNTLLSQVVDGLGNLTTITYDNPGTYKTDEKCGGSTWPETCLKQMAGLVGSHQEGFVGSNGQDVIERSYSYSNSNARMNLTGQGWLGFDRRTVTEQVVGLPPRSVTTEFEPVARYDLQGLPTQSTNPPYVYPRAGLPRIITIGCRHQFASMPKRDFG
jgi:hypothetical protein